MLAVLQLSVLPQRWLPRILLFAFHFKKGEEKYFFCVDFSFVHGHYWFDFWKTKVKLLVLPTYKDAEHHLASVLASSSSSSSVLKGPLEVLLLLRILREIRVSPGENCYTAASVEIGFSSLFSFISFTVRSFKLEQNVCLLYFKFLCMTLLASLRYQNSRGTTQDSPVFWKIVYWVLRELKTTRFCLQLQKQEKS